MSAGQLALFQDDLTLVLRDSLRYVRDRKAADSAPNIRALVLAPVPAPDKLYVSDGRIFGLYNGGQPPYFHHIEWSRLAPVQKVSPLDDTSRRNQAG